MDSHPPAIRIIMERDTDQVLHLGTSLLMYQANPVRLV